MTPQKIICSFTFFPKSTVLYRGAQYKQGTRATWAISMVARLNALINQYVN